MARLNQAQYYNEPVEKQMGFSASVQSGSLIHLAGIVSVDLELNVVGAGDMAAQIKQIYQIMEATLARCGATFENVVSERIYVTDMGALAEASSVRSEIYASCAAPATTAVQVAALFFPEAMIEIEATAMLD